MNGLVNQKGQYLDGHRIFEGIYIDDTPVKKSVDPYADFLVNYSVQLSSLVQKMTDPWIQNGEFVEKSFSDFGLTEISYDPTRSVNDPYSAILFQDGTLSGEIIFGRRNIAKALFRGRNLLRALVDDSSIDSQPRDIARQKLLRYDAFSTWGAFETQVLKDYPLSTEYPFFCFKINLGNYYNVSAEPLQSGEFPLTKYSSFVLDSDLQNLVFQKLEVSEIGKRRVLRPLSWMDMTYSLGTSVGGYIYVFGIAENNFPTKESILAARNNLQRYKIVDGAEEKYNYTNILAEVRNGEELQPPLGFFDKTYLDKEYGIKLLGPFSNQGETLKLSSFVKPDSSGVIADLAEQTNAASALGGEVLITEAEKAQLEIDWNLAGRLTKDGSKRALSLRYMATYASNIRKTITVTQTGFSATVVYNAGTIVLTKTDGVFTYRITSGYDQDYTDKGDLWGYANEFGMHRIPNSLAYPHKSLCLSV